MGKHNALIVMGLLICMCGWSVAARAESPGGMAFELANEGGGVARMASEPEIGEGRSAVMQSAPITGLVTVADVQLEARDVTEMYRRDAAGMRGIAGTRDTDGARASAGPCFITATGTMNAESGQAGRVTTDGGYVTAGYYYNFTSADFNALIVKYDADGWLEWARTVGADGFDAAYAVEETPDGGFVISGRTDSFGVGETDVLLAKFNSAGVLLWARTAGGSGSDDGVALCVTSGGDFVVTGYTTSFGAASYDILVLGFDADGTLAWTRMIGGSGLDTVSSIHETMDGGLVAAGYTDSYGAGSYDFLLLRLTSSGTLSWARTAGGSYLDQGQDVVETADGGFVLTGQTSSYGIGASDVFLVKFDNGGTYLWARTAGGSPNGDSAYEIFEKPGGELVVAGSTYNFGAGDTDAFLLGFDTYGTLNWARSFGGIDTDRALALGPISGGGFMLAGETASFGSGSVDLFHVVTDSSGIVPGCDASAACYPETDSPSPVVTAPSPSTSSPAASVTSPADIADLYEPFVDEVCRFTPPDPEYFLAASGGPNGDFGYAVGRTPDGGLLVGGQSGSYTTWEDTLLIKYDSDGDLEWARTAGGTDQEAIYGLQVTADGGCIAVGFTESFGVGTMTADVFILMYDGKGTLLWAKTVGGASIEAAWGVDEITEGRYVVAGNTQSAGAGLSDGLVLEIDGSGTVQWVRTVGSAASERIRSCEVTSDGGILLGGHYSSGNNLDALVIKLDGAGLHQWHSVVGSGGDERFWSVIETSDGGYVACGDTDSYGAYKDIYLVKFDGAGARQWVRHSGTSDNEEAFEVAEMPDGDLVTAGQSSPWDSPINDALLCRFDASGEFEWARTIERLDVDSDLQSVTVTADNGIAAAGSLNELGPAPYDFLVLRTGPNGHITDCDHLSSVSLTTSTQYPPTSGYSMVSQIPSMSIYTRTPTIQSPVPGHVELCHGTPTASASVTCSPSSGTVPFNSLFSVTLNNHYTGQTRRIAAYLTATLANSNHYPNWKSGFTNVAAGGSKVIAWTQIIPALGAVIGDNLFQLTAEDVTPAPYNLPPYPPAGETDTDAATVTGLAP